MPRQRPLYIRQKDAQERLDKINLRIKIDELRAKMPLRRKPRRAK